MSRVTVRCIQCGARPRALRLTRCNICMIPSRRSASMKGWRTRKMMAAARADARSIPEARMYRPE